MRKQIFLDIQQKVLSIVDNNNEPIIKNFDFWNNQLKFLSTENPFNSPAVFLEFHNITWHTLGCGVREGEFSFSLHVVTRFYGNTHNESPCQDSQLDFLDIPELIANILDHTRITNSSSMTLTSTSFDNNHEQYIESIDTYTCRVRCN
jgi:hypothetical protein